MLGSSVIMPAAACPAAPSSWGWRWRRGDRTWCTACAGRTTVRHIIRPGVDVELSVMAAGAAGDVKPGHAVLVHVAECHRPDRLIPGRHVGPLTGAASHVAPTARAAHSLASFLPRR